MPIKPASPYRCHETVDFEQFELKVYSGEIALQAKSRWISAINLDGSIQWSYAWRTSWYPNLQQICLEEGQDRVNAILAADDQRTAAERQRLITAIRRDLERARQIVPEIQTRVRAAEEERTAQNQAWSQAWDEKYAGQSLFGSCRN